MIIGHVFSFLRDQKLVIQNLNHLIQIGVDKVVIIDDGSCPMDKSYAEKIANLQGDYTKTGWRRRGNLNGQEAIIGIIGEFMRSYMHLLDESGKEYADESIFFKLDADTSISDISMFERMREHDAAFMFFDDRGSAYGAFYAFKGRMIWPLLQEFIKLPTHDMAQEDLFIGSRARAHVRARGGYEIQLPMRRAIDDSLGNGPAGIVAPYSWQRYPHDIETLRGLKVVSFGNMRSPELSTIDHTAKAMQLWVEMLKKDAGNLDKTNA